MDRKCNWSCVCGAQAFDDCIESSYTDMSFEKICYAGFTSAAGLALKLSTTPGQTSITPSNGRCSGEMTPSFRAWRVY